MSFVATSCIGSSDAGGDSDGWFKPVFDKAPGSLAELCEVGACVAGVVLPDGAVIESTVDLEMPESLGALSVGRVWTGQRSGIFGAGWESIWDVEVMDGVLVGAVPARPLVAPSVPGEVPLADGSSLTFDDAGRVVEVCESEAICTQADWSDTRLLLSPAGSASERIELHLDGSRVARAVSADGRAVAYAYSDDRLSSASTPSGVHRYDHTDTGLLALVETPLGTRRFTYDESGSVTALVDTYGGRWRFESVGDDEVLVERPDGTNRRYVFEGHRLIEASDSELGVLLEREYRDHVLITERRPLDAVTIDLVDDGRLQVITETGMVPVTALYRFDDVGRVVEVESGGGVTTFLYDGFRTTPSVIETAAGIHRYEYDDHGLVVAMIDADGYRLDLDRAPNGLARHADDGLTGIEFEYDNAGRIVAETIGDATTRTIFDERGLVASTVSPSGVETQYTYDEAGRLVAVDGPDPVRISYTEDGWLDEASIHLLGIDDAPELPMPVSPPVTHNSDGSAQVVTEFGATILADRWGRVTRIEADGTVAERHYDEAGRLIRYDGPDGAFVFTYTSAGRVSSIETEGVSIDMEWAGDLLLSAAMSTGSVYRFDYDLGGRVTAAHHGPLRWDYAYDLDGRLVEVHTPAGALTSRWDESGRPVASVSGSGDGRVFDWDRRGRLMSVEHVDGDRTEIDYDADGRVLELRGVDGERRFDYDDLGRVIAAETENGRAEWAHGQDGVNEVTFDGRSEIWSYRDGQLSTITIDGIDHELDWAAPGVLASVIADGEVLALGQFDGAGRLLSATGADGEVAASFEWSRFGISSGAIDGDEFRIDRNLEGQVTGFETADGLRATVDYMDGVPVAVRADDTELTFSYTEGRLAESSVRTADGEVTLVWAADGASLERFTSSAGSGTFGYVDGAVDTVTVGDQRSEVIFSDSGVLSAPATTGQLINDLFDDLGVFIGPMTPLDTAPRAPLIDFLPADVRPAWPTPVTADAVVDAALAAVVPDLALPLAPQRASGWAEEMISTAIGIGANINVPVGPAQHVSVLLQPTGNDLAGVLAASSSVRSAESVLERLGGGSCLLCGITDFGTGVLSSIGSAATSLYRFVVDNPIMKTVTSFAFVATAFVTSFLCGGVACTAGLLAGSVLLAQFVTSDSTGIAERTFETFAAPIRSLVSGIGSLDALAVASGAAVIAAAVASRRFYSSPVNSRALQRACSSDRVACLSYSRYPGAAGNILVAQRAGVGRVARVNRVGANERRREYLATIPVRAGLDRDEFPMAMMRASNRRVFGAYIPPADNRGAGSVIGRQLAPLGDGQPFFTLVVP